MLERSRCHCAAGTWGWGGQALGGKVGRDYYRCFFSVSLGFEVRGGNSEKRKNLETESLSSPPASLELKYLNVFSSFGF